jgi:hypothetical protein
MLALAFAAALAAAGCNRGGVMPAVTVGPVAREPSRLVFERVLQAVRAQGYEPLAAEPTSGYFAVQARAQPPRGGTYIHVQCYRDGRVQLVPSGPRIARRARGFRVTSELRDEIVVLAAAIDGADHAGY